MYKKVRDALIWKFFILICLAAVFFHSLTYTTSQGPFSKFNTCRKSRNVMWEEARLHQLTRAMRKNKTKVNCLGSFVIANGFLGLLYKVKFVANKKVWHLHVFQQHQSLCKRTPPPSWSRNSRVICSGLCACARRTSRFFDSSLFPRRRLPDMTCFMTFPLLPTKSPVGHLNYRKVQNG